MQIPRDADAYISGSYYKVGVMEKAFIFVNGGWVLSTREVSEVESYIHKMRKAGQEALSTEEEGEATKKRRTVSH